MILLNQLQYDVFEYLNLPAEDKLDFFMETRSSLKFMADYWVNFDKVKNFANLVDTPEMYALDYLIGKNDPELLDYFLKYQESFKLIPSLLGIRKDKFKKGTKILEVQDLHGVYELDFENIKDDDYELYIRFIFASGLADLLKSGLKKSVYDYNTGVEAGMDSNARKNRSGKMGELYLESLLNSIATKPEWLTYGQTSAKYVKEEFGITLDKSFNNRKFDGSLYNTRRKKLYLFEVNNFNSTGSKSKASATEFINLSNRLAMTNNEFIYITDGVGWDSDKSHLFEAMKHIGKVFNYNMVEDGYLEDYLFNF